MFGLATTGLWLFPRGHPGRLRRVAWIHEGGCLLEYTSALAFVPQNELRLSWFYIMQGQRAGLAVTLLTLIYLALFFHLYLWAWAASAGRNRVLAQPMPG